MRRLNTSESRAERMLSVRSSTHFSTRFPIAQPTRREATKTNLRSSAMWRVSIASWTNSRSWEASQSSRAGKSERMTCVVVQMAIVVQPPPAVDASAQTPPAGLRALRVETTHLARAQQTAPRGMAARHGSRRAISRPTRQAGGCSGSGSTPPPRRCRPSACESAVAPRPSQCAWGWVSAP